MEIFILICTYLMFPVYALFPSSQIQYQFQPLAQKSLRHAIGNFEFEIAFQNGSQKQIGERTDHPIELTKIFKYLESSQMNCHVVLDNHQGSDISPINYPVILRLSKPVLLDRRIYTRKIKRQYDTFWFPNNWIQSSIKNRSRLQFKFEKSRVTFKCPTTQVLQSFTRRGNAGENSYDLCVRLELFKLSSASKPWNCEIQTSILLPITYVTQFTVVGGIIVFHHNVGPNKNIQQYKSIPPTKVSRVFILVAKEKEHLKKWSYKMYSLWLKLTLNNLDGRRIFNDVSPVVSHQENFVCLVASINHSGYSSDGQVLTIKRILKTSYNLNAHTINVLEYRWSTITISTSVDNNMALWLLTASAAQSSTILARIMSHLFQCKNYLWPTPKVHSVNKLPFEDRMDKLAHGIVSLVMATFKNFTFIDEEKEILCVNGHIRKTKRKRWALSRPVYSGMEMAILDASKSLVFPLSIIDETSNLRFISCGRQNGNEMLAFSEFISVYQGQVWLCILLSLILVANVSVKLSKFHHHNIIYAYTEHLFMLLKCLLEQGDPFKAKLLRLEKHRYIITSCLLAGIVLSNAYKNTNVYNLIAPRHLMPYEKMSELVRDNFTVLTRSTIDTTAGIQDWWELYNADFLRNFSGSYWTNHEFKSGDSYFPFLIESQVSLFFAEKLVSEEIKNGTFIHPKLSEHIHETLKAMWPNWTKFDPENGTNYMNAIANQLRNVEENLIAESWRSCVNIAILLPLRLCNEYKIKSIRDNVNGNVFIGKEKYVNASITFAPHGLMHPNVMRRLETFTVTGLWRYWFNLIELKVGNEEVTQDFKAPTMKGNIQAVFTIYLLGILIACLIYSMEMLTSILSEFANSLKFCNKYFVNVCSADVFTKSMLVPVKEKISRVWVWCMKFQI